MISEMEDKLSPEDKKLREWDRFFREDLHVDLMFLNDVLYTDELIKYRDKVLKPLLLKRVDQKVKDNSSKFPDILGEFKAGKGFFTNHLYNKFFSKLGEIEKSEPVKEIHRAELKILKDFVDNSGCNYFKIKDNMEYGSHDLVSVEWFRCIYKDKKSNEPSIQNIIDFMNEGLSSKILIPPRNGYREMINPEIDNEYGIQNHSNYLLGLLRNFDKKIISLYIRLRGIDPQYIKDKENDENKRYKINEEEKKKLINELKKMGVKFTENQSYLKSDLVMTISYLKDNPEINPAEFEYKVLEEDANRKTQKKRSLINEMKIYNQAFMRNNDLSKESIETIEKVISFFKEHPENKDATLLSIKAETKTDALPAPPAQNSADSAVFKAMQEGTTTLPLGPHEYVLGDGLDEPSGGRRRKRTKKRTNLKHTRKDRQYKSRRDRHKSRRDRHKSRRDRHKSRRDRHKSRRKTRKARR